MCPDAPLSGPDDLCQDDALQNGAVLQEFLNFRVICGLVHWFLYSLWLTIYTVSKVHNGDLFADLWQALEEAAPDTFSALDGDLNY